MPTVMLMTYAKYAGGLSWYDGSIGVSGQFLQENHAIAKMTVRCTQYMSALKIFESVDYRKRLLCPKFVRGFCSDWY